MTGLDPERYPQALADLQRKAKRLDRFMDFANRAYFKEMQRGAAIAMMDDFFEEVEQCMWLTDFMKRQAKRQAGLEQ